MANDFKVRKGLIVLGSGSSTPTDIYGSQGELFSITDSLSGSLFSVNDISGIPVIEAFSNNWVNLGTFNREGLKVRGDVVIATGSFSGSLVGSASFATTASFAITASYSNQSLSSSYSTQTLSASYSNQSLSSSYAVTSSYALNGGGGNITIADDGISQGTATFLNFSGSVISATVSSNTASISVELSASYAQTFTDETLLTVTHNLDTDNPFVQLYDTSNNVFIPERITATNSNQVEVEFTTTTSGRIAIAKAGHVVSGTVENIISSSFTEILSLTTNRQTGSYTLQLTDVGKLIEMNVATPNNLTVPLSSSVDFATGSLINVTQYGAGQTTIISSSGVTIRSSNNWTRINSRYGFVTLVKIGANEWYLYGNLNA